MVAVLPVPGCCGASAVGYQGSAGKSTAPCLGERKTWLKTASHLVEMANGWFGSAAQLTDDTKES